MSSEARNDKRDRIYKILTASLFTLVSFLLLGAGTYWSLSRVSPCSVKPERIVRYVSISVVPKDAVVIIDTVTIQQQLLADLQLWVGTHHYFASAKGFKARGDTFVVHEGENNAVHILLEKYPYAKMVLGSNPPGALVFLDEVQVGKTKYENDTLEPGEHTITVMTQDQKQLWKEKRDFAPSGSFSKYLPFSSSVETSIKSVDQNGHDLPGAYIFIDEAQLPAYDGPAKTPAATSVPFGYHEITVRMEGYKPAIKEMNFETKLLHPLVFLLRREH